MPTTEHMTLQGKVALVTGSSRGIGKGIALALAAQGCAVAVNYVRKRADAEATVAEIEALGARACALKAHVGEEAEMRRLVDDAAAALGGLDIFVANAASGVLRPVLELESKAWDWTLNINARSILVGAQAAVPHMRTKGWGRIIAVSSIGSRRVYTNYAAVGVSKAAIESVMRYLAVELAPEAILCNTLSPGIVITGALDHFPNKDDMIGHALANTPTQRLATPEDVGRVAAWLCTDDAAMIVGQVIEIDGGYSLVVGR